MEENKTGQKNPVVTNQEGDEEFVLITLRKHTAVELLNALITSLGGISEPNKGGGGPSGGSPLSIGGDSTTDSDR